MAGTIAEGLLRLSDADLATCLPHIRDGHGERLVSVVQLRHILRDEVKRIREEAKDEK